IDIPVRVVKLNVSVFLTKNVYHVGFGMLWVRTLSRGIKEKVDEALKDWDAWVDTPVIDEDEVIQEEETVELIDEFQNVEKLVPTIFDHERMEATIKYMLSNQFGHVEEYAYYLEQAQNYMENQIVWESRKRT
nr:hypothetical protein [Tanacetum cinerariifolium]